MQKTKQKTKQKEKEKKTKTKTKTNNYTTISVISATGHDHNITHIQSIIVRNA